MTPESIAPPESSLPEAKAAPAGFTTVSATYLTDSTGTLVNNATIYFQPIDTYGNWLSYATNNHNGQAMWQSVWTAVSNGAFSIVLADTSLTYPKNIAYQVSIIDNVSGANLLGPGYLIQPSGATWDFDNYLPRVPMTPTTQGVLTSDYFTGAVGGLTSFTLSHTPLMNMLNGLYFNGLMQRPGIDYTFTGNQLTTNFSVGVGDNLYAVYFS